MKHTILFTISIALVFSLQSCKQAEKKGKDLAVDTTPQEELSESPRHHEWRTTERSDGTALETFYVYPEVSKAAPGVIVIHENRGLNDWARSFADQLAEKGFLVAAPDLISNTVDGVKRTTDFANSDEARRAIYELDPDMVTADLDAVFQMLKDDPACSGEISVIGFCWGGSQSFRYATNNEGLENALVFYGTAPKDATEFQRISCPVYGFYGENDNRVNATIEATQLGMKAASKTYEPVIYKGATHAFMRKGDQAETGVEREARNQAWDRLLSILQE